jgi:hypothetical protein
VARLSLLSNWTDVDPAPEISIPKLLAGMANQVCASAVTSTRMNVLATLTGAVANTAPTVGWLAEVTAVSLQDDVTSAKSNVPPVATWFA